MNTGARSLERKDAYAAALADYCRTREDSFLEAAETLAGSFVVADVEPGAIVDTHVAALPAAVAAIPLRQRAQAALASHQFLLEVVIAYGTQLREHLEKRAGRRLRRLGKRAALDRARAEVSERRGAEQAEVLLSVVHELGQPLAALNGSLQLAERAIARGETARVQPNIGRSREALSRLGAMVADLHRSARGEALELEAEPIDLTEVVRQSIAAARGAAAEKGVILVDDGVVEIPYLVEGDADALLSVIGNILSNALRYTQAGGRVAVAVTLEGDRVVTQVSDTGIGMKPEVLEHIFERAYRAPEARALAGDGLGLGLALARRLVLAQGGSILVESEHGTGSTFRILLPAASSRSGHSGGHA